MPALDVLLDAAVHAAEKDQNRLSFEDERAQANPFAGIKGMAAKACSVSYDPDSREYFLRTNYPAHMIQPGY